MRVEVLYFEGCPNHAPTVERVRAELMSYGVTEEIEEVKIHNQSQAEALGFLGSPSVRIDRLDIEGEARNLKSFGMSCRTYLEGAVRSGLPSNELIRRALNEQTSQAGGGGAASKSDDSCCQVDSVASAAAKSDHTRVPSAESPPSGSIALFSGGLAAILASTCCLGPLVLVTLGISGAWIGNLALLEPYRPFFILIALVALFLAWRSIYRQACQSGDQCSLSFVPNIRQTGLKGTEAAKILSQRIRDSRVRSPHRDIAAVIQTTRTGVRPPKRAEVCHLSIDPKEGVKVLVTCKVRSTVYPVSVVDFDDQTAIGPAERAEGLHGVMSLLCGPLLLILRGEPNGHHQRSQQCHSSKAHQESGLH